MKILFVHNSYQQHGGEDTSFETEKAVLVSAGHPVLEYVRSNNEIPRYGFWDTATLPARPLWAWDTYRELKVLLRREKPDLCHFQNTFPLISPGAYYACREAGVPTLQVLHNYRLFCPVGTFARNGRPCEECVEHSLRRGIRYGCYRESRTATATVALMLATHRIGGTWAQMVDCYLALTPFARQKFIASGLPSEKIMIKPNCLYPDPGARDGTTNGKYALFVGRLAAEKGLRTLLLAWERLKIQIPLLIVGDGSVRPQLETQAKQSGLTNVFFQGRLAQERTVAMIKEARFLVFPSEWYEGFPMTIVEAFACGIPVLCSRMGALPDIVTDGRTGLHVTPRDAEELAEKVEWAWKNPERLQEMGRNARADYEGKYTGDTKCL